MQLPSKKILPVFLACVIAGGGVAVAAAYKTPAQPDPRLIVETPQTQTPTFPNDDSWKKTLAVVATSTDASTDDASSTDSAASTTLTESISKELLSSYLEQTQNGGQVTDDFENNLVNKLVDDSSNSVAATNAKVYTADDIKVSNNNSIAAIRLYGNALGEAIIKNTSATTTDQLLIYDNAANNNDPGSVSAIIPIIESYQKTLTAFLSITVPSNAVNLHINLINSYSQIIAADEMLIKYPTDPVLSMYGLKQYDDASKMLYSSIQAYPVFFTTQGALFSPNEAGYMLSSLNSGSN